MTEAEWMVCQDPHKLLGFRRRRPNQRKERLFACACVRGVWKMVILSEFRHALEVAEAYAEGVASEGELDTAHHACELICEEDAPAPAELAALYAAAPEQFFSAVDASRTSISADGVGFTPEQIAVMADARSELGLGSFDDVSEETAVANAGRRRHDHVALIHDIFGNPFRPVAFAAEWRTSTVVALAQQMYESRDFSALPILADALQDAGCDNDDILTHCRDANGVHVRGCWVVDMILGKE